MLCPLLSLPTVPLLGRYDQQLYELRPVLRHAKYDGVLPSALVAALCRLQPIESCECIEVEYDCTGVNDTATLNVLFHSTVFYDALDLREFCTSVKAAVFPSDECFSQYSLISRPHPDWLKRSPLNLLAPEVSCEVRVHPDGHDICCSPDNCKVGVRSVFPVTEFFSVLLVPFHDSLVRRVVCRHILRFRHSELLCLPVPETEAFLARSLSLVHLEDWCEELVNDREALRAFLMWFIWLTDGCPTHEREYGDIVLASFTQQRDLTLAQPLALSHQRYRQALLQRVVAWASCFSNKPT
jgi:hypothetical protein